MNQTLSYCEACDSRGRTDTGRNTSYSMLLITLLVPLKFSTISPAAASLAIGSDTGLLKSGNAYLGDYNDMCNDFCMMLD